MPLIHEDGTGVLNADSYVSVAEADAYHSLRGNDAWGLIGTETKEALLRKASDYITDKYRGAFIGNVYYNGNILAWPRFSHEIRYYNLLSVGVPLEVRQATAELALIANTENLTPNISRGKKRVKVGSIEVEYDGNSPMQTQFVTASLRLTAYLRSGTNGMARLQRV